MTTLAQIRHEQARCGEWLRSHADWRESDDMADVPGFGKMRKRVAYAGHLAGACDWIMEEALAVGEAQS